MENLISCCGLDCATCPALKATLENDQQLREQTAATWSKMYGADIKPESIVCEGCLSSGDRLFHHCTVCEIRKCCNERGHVNCAVCPDYGCDIIAAFHKQVPEAKQNLDNLR